MTPIFEFVAALAEEIDVLTAERGCKVAIDAREVLDRSDSLALSSPGRVSANGSCRLIATADHWVAVNLARPDDWELAPAWLCRDDNLMTWETIAAALRTRPWRDVTEAARLLGMPVAAVGEIKATGLRDMHAKWGEAGRSTTFSVVDLSSLWAGPLCGGVLAAAGASVTKIESRQRPDTTHLSAYALHDRLNGRKRILPLDFSNAEELAVLHQMIAKADVLITNARPRATERLGLDPARLFQRNPTLTWVSISGYGWLGGAADRVAFGDDAAAAGGLVRWDDDHRPNFIGDAIADPITGLFAAIGALHSLRAGGGYFIDASLAHTAARVAEAC